jgi:hypothetical protein
LVIFVLLCSVIFLLYGICYNNYSPGVFNGVSMLIGELSLHYSPPLRWIIVKYQTCIISNNEDPSWWIESYNKYTSCFLQTKTYTYPWSLKRIFCQGRAGVLKTTTNEQRHLRQRGPRRIEGWVNINVSGMGGGGGGRSPILQKCYTKNFPHILQFFLEYKIFPDMS